MLEERMLGKEIQPRKCRFDFIDPIQAENRCSIGYAVLTKKTDGSSDWISCVCSLAGLSECLLSEA